MAINTWINVTVDAGASRKADSADHRHAAVGGTASAGDVSMAFDSAKVPSLAVLDSSYAAIRQRAMAGGLK